MSCAPQKRKNYRKNRSSNRNTLFDRTLITKKQGKKIVYQRTDNLVYSRRIYIYISIHDKRSKLDEIFPRLRLRRRIYRYTGRNEVIREFSGESKKKKNVNYSSRA